MIGRLWPYIKDESTILAFDCRGRRLNPHSHIVIIVGTDATDGSTIGTWDIEASSISIRVSQGWKRNTFEPGDRITVVAHPSRNGSMNALLYYAIKPDGTRLYRAQHRYPSEAE
ncbi:MAG: DUF6152 family protein [Steroidobacteraceae bacterium]